MGQAQSLKEDQRTQRKFSRKTFFFLSKLLYTNWSYLAYDYLRCRIIWKLEKKKISKIVLNSSRQEKKAYVQHVYRKLKK